MKRVISLIALLALLSSFAYGEVQLQETDKALELEIETLKNTYEPFYAENYQTREVPQFYVEEYDIEVPYMAIGYVSGYVRDGLPQGSGTLKIFDYNKDGSVEKTMKFIGTFEDGMLVGDGQIFIDYENDPTELLVHEVMGNFYYGLLHGKSTLVLRKVDSDSKSKQSTIYEGTYKFGDKEGLFTETQFINDESTTHKGEFSNNVKVGEWLPVVEEEITSN